MKANTKVCAARAMEFGLKSDSLKIGRKNDSNMPSDGEMMECFSKLKELVPTIPRDRKLSRVQLLQHVIDYIFDLEETLEHHPAIMTPPPELLQAALTIERRPLAENTHHQHTTFTGKTFTSAVKNAYVHLHVVILSMNN